MASTVAKLPKPQLRGLLKSYLQKHLALSVVVGICGSVAWKVFVADPRKQAYADFYKTYDAEAHYQQMQKAGVLPEFPPVR